MINKFKVAFYGLYTAFKDKSVFIQFVLAFLAILISIIFKIKIYDFIIVLFCICMVITCEILNTCIEELCNMYTTGYNEKVKKIKDMGAAAVLFSSITSLIVGIAIFIKYI